MGDALSVEEPFGLLQLGAVGDAEAEVVEAHPVRIEAVPGRRHPTRGGAGPGLAAGRRGGDAGQGEELGAGAGVAAQRAQ